MKPLATAGEPIHGTSLRKALPGRRWENRYCESFNARFRDELLNGEVFYSQKRAQTLIEE